MGRINRFVVPQIKRIQISNEDWIEVKLDLNTGESKILENAGRLTPVLLNGTPFQPVDWGIYELTKVQLFLTDWSFKDAEDKPVKVGGDSIRQLDPMDFNEIAMAISKHINERALEKKASRDSLKSVSPASPESTPTSQS